MPSLRLAGVVGLAWAGVVVGHGIGYAGESLGAPSLAATAHGSFSVALVSAIAIVPAALSLLALRALHIGSQPRVLHAAAWLAGIQLPIFALMELVLIRAFRSLVGRSVLPRTREEGQRWCVAVDPYLSPFVFLIAVRLRAPPSCLAER